VHHADALAATLFDMSIPPTGAIRSWLRVSAALVGAYFLTAAALAAQAPGSTVLDASQRLRTERS
jgi:hypothetical protein